ncbi:hypothetical protein LTR36_006122 [Oleoguttula mirabilis]|uniref:NIMA interactive protein n=1 Tax=Oleoguttula mirabilis TaxID=1507867 RepID=A0AAV9JC07_9PEZI|nr:hypothetical protein LTR36_006122 [Oleoguttula mirabilis]
MDHESLRTASTYLNNLLLARGLLRNSEPIDFVKPSKDSRAQIINLVHDLILREDRDRDNREHVAITLRNVRAEESRKNLEIEKLKTREDESARAAIQAQTAQRAAEGEVKKVEKAMRTLQDQTARLKTSIAQVKTQCQNDVRKRDLELARLKTHLQGQQRGQRVVAPSASITGSSSGARGKQSVEPAHDLDDPAYTLRQETTEFLTQLSQSLSDENDSLITLIRGALGTMREVLGLPAHGRKHPDSAIGSMASDDDAKRSRPNLTHTLSTPYEMLDANMAECLAQLKTVLSNPDFVTIEEVEVREEEIARLREGWERMEQRWKDVLRMMDGWRRRMDTGDTINIDDLRHGMGMVSPERVHHGGDLEEAEPEQSFADMEDVSEIRLPGITEEDETSMLQEPPRRSSPLAKRLASAKSSPKRKRDVLEPPAFFDLRLTGYKSAPASPGVSEQGFEPILEEGEDGSELGGYDYSESQPHMTVEEKLHAAQAEAEEAAAARAAAAAAASTPRIRTRSRNEPSNTNASANKGADAEPGSAHPASTRPSKRAADPEPRPLAFGLDGTCDDAEEQDDTLGKLPAASPVKKTRIRGRPKRRKSTLNPAELEELLMSAADY